MADQTRLWTEKYERELAGILVLQSDVARNVARALALKLLPAEQARLANARAVIPEAYDACQKGTYHWQKLTREDLDTAERYFELALDKDPSYAPAYEGLSWVWSARQAVFTATPQEAGPKAKAAALQAIALDDTSAGAHEVLATVKTWTDRDWAGAESEWKTHPGTGPQRRERARVLRPLPDDHRACRGGASAQPALHRAGPVQRAVSRLPREGPVRRRAVTTMRWRRPAPRWPCSPARRGLPPAALECAFICERDVRGAPGSAAGADRGDPERLAALEQGFAEAGYQGAMRRVAESLAARYEKSGGVPDPKAPGLASQPPGIIAAWYAHAGDYGRAIDWLEKGFQGGGGDMPIASHPHWDPVRSDPRFQALIRRLGLPQ